MLESLFKKVSDWRARKFLKSTHFVEHLLTAAFERPYIDAVYTEGDLVFSFVDGVGGWVPKLVISCERHKCLTPKNCTLFFASLRMLFQLYSSYPVILCTPQYMLQINSISYEVPEVPDWFDVSKKL